MAGKGRVPGGAGLVDWCILDWRKLDRRMKIRLVLIALGVVVGIIFSA